MRGYLIQVKLDNIPVAEWNICMYSYVCMRPEYPGTKNSDI